MTTLINENGTGVGFMRVLWNATNAYMFAGFYRATAVQ